MESLGSTETAVPGAEINRGNGGGEINCWLKNKGGLMPRTLMRVWEASPNIRSMCEWRVESREQTSRKASGVKNKQGSQGVFRRPSTDPEHSRIRGAGLLRRRHS